MKPIFVFGSNLIGVHGAGAAKYAYENLGAEMGKGIGIQGESYALPTKDEHIKTLSLDKIEYFIYDFLDYARNNPDKWFRLTPIGCGLAGYKKSDIWGILKKCDIPENVLLTREWING